MANFLDTLVRITGPTGQAAEDFLTPIFEWIDSQLTPPVGDPVSGEPIPWSLGLAADTPWKPFGAMKHAGSATSPEAIKRLRSGTKFFKIDRAGKLTPSIGVDAIDAPVKAGEALVKVSPNGEVLIERGTLASQRAMEAFNSLGRGKVAKKGGSSLQEPPVDMFDIGDEDVEAAMKFLRDLGVEF